MKKINYLSILLVSIVGCTIKEAPKLTDGAQISGENIVLILKK